MRSLFLPALPASLRFPLVLFASAALAALSAGCGETFVAGSGGAGAGGATGAAGSTTSPGTGGASSVSAGGGGSTSTVTSCEPLAADECNTCLAQSCTGRYCTCTGDGACAGFLECLALDLPDPAYAWFEKCWQENPGSASQAGMLSVCAKANCPSCGVDYLTDCLACQYESCPDEVDACFSNGYCTGFLTCAKACKDAGGDPGCMDTCNEDAGTHLALAQALVQCAVQKCPEECANQ